MKTSSCNAKPQRRRQPEKVREKVLKAALAMFAARGYEGATLQQVAKMAEVSLPLIVYHFKSKEKLWQAVIEEAVRHFDQLIDGVISDDSELSAGERLRAIIEATVRVSVKFPEFHRIMATESYALTERLTWICENFAKRHYTIITTLIAAAQAEGGVIDLEPYRLSGVIVDMANSASRAAEYQILTGRDPFSSEEVENTIVAINKVVFRGAGP
ncbi:MAG: TetR/AcrR family transcriptional regulator [Porticoccaceae bacterium]